MKEILENENLKTHFITAMKQKKVSHAYILEGEKGSGKKTAACAFASLLQCERRGEEEEPCGCCESCIMITNGSHPDVIRVHHEKQGVISVGEVREQIVNTVDVMPYKGPYKIYIIDEAEKMNPAAQNAILKTIEEPPSYVIIMLLTTNKGAFLPTILSRCILLNMKPISDKTIRKYLTEYGGISEETADFCTGFSMGNLGKAKAAAESEEFTEMRENAMSILRYLHEIQDYEIAEKVKILKKWKDSIDDYFDMMLIWFRDILTDKAIKNEKYLIFQSELTYIRKQSEQLSYEDINEIIREVGQTAKRIRANVNFDTSLEILHIDIKRRFFKENR